MNSFQKFSLRAYPVPGSAQGSKHTAVRRMWQLSWTSSLVRGETGVHTTVCSVENALMAEQPGSYGNKAGSWLLTLIGGKRVVLEKGHLR